MKWTCRENGPSGLDSPDIKDSKMGRTTSGRCLETDIKVTKLIVFFKSVKKQNGAQSNKTWTFREIEVAIV